MADNMSNEVPTAPPDRRNPKTLDTLAATRPGAVYPGAAADAVHVPESVPETVIPRPATEASVTARPNRSLILWVAAVVIVIVLVAIALS